MVKYVCPYCKTTFTLNNQTFTEYYPSFNYTNTATNPALITSRPLESEINLRFYNCPECEKYSIELEGLGAKVGNIDLRVQPFGSSKEFPNYIPDVVRNDYKEACLIKDLSPKASATLARRCLQGMIRDFWKVSKKNLYEEINALKELIPAAQWKVLDSVRKIGNIGAHMEKDIDVIIEIEPHEAERLIRLIEFLMKEWYINRHETQLLFEEITQIADDKKISKTILRNS